MKEHFIAHQNKDIPVFHLYPQISSYLYMYSQYISSINNHVTASLRDKGFADDDVMKIAKMMSAYTTLNV